MTENRSQTSRSRRFYKRYLKEECTALTTDADSITSSCSDSIKSLKVCKSKGRVNLNEIIPKDLNERYNDIISKISGLPYYFNSDIPKKIRSARNLTTLRTPKKPLHPPINGYVVIAYPNGTLHEGVRISGHTIKSVLEQATARLELNSAARRLFWRGQEIFEGDDLPNYVSVAISTGGSYIDMEKINKNNSKVQWTMNGVKLEKNHSKSRNTQSSNNRLVHIFENGHGKGECYVNGNVENFICFLEDSSRVLSLSNSAKVVYDINGRQVRDISKLPKIPDFVQKGYMFGPVWVSSGGTFDPNGALEYLKGKLLRIKELLQQKYHEIDQLDLCRNNPDDDQIEPRYQSMTPFEVETESKHTKRTVSDLKETRDFYGEIERRLRSIEFKRNENIPKIDDGNRLVVNDVVQLTVFLVGISTERIETKYDRGRSRVVHKRDKMFSKFLELMSSLGFKSTGSCTKIVKRVFDEDGKEIFDVYSLTSGSFIWVSFGENFHQNIDLILAVKIEKIDFYCNKSDIYFTRVLFDEDEICDINANYKWERMNVEKGSCKEISDSELGEMLKREELERVDGNLFLKNLEKTQVVMSPQVRMIPKDNHKYADIWKTLVIHQNGLISCKSNSKYVLMAGGTELCDDQEYVDVVLGVKDSSNSLQRWTFTNDGFMFLNNNTEKVLTLLKIGPSNYKAVLADKVKGKPQSSQRWGIRQESSHNLGQWRFCTVPNPEWHKRGFSWPVDENGEFNQKYDWPMEGFLVPCAPPLTISKGKISCSAKRLFVVKNGEINLENGAFVTGPDISKLKNKRGGQTAAEIEMQLFMERVTLQLRMPTFARRLFDEDGREHFTLNNLVRDQIVFTSVNEDFVSPRRQTNNQRRNMYERKLYHDISLLELYYKHVAFPNHYVVLVSDKVLKGSNVTLGPVLESERNQNEFVYEEATKMISLKCDSQLVLGIAKKPTSTESIEVVVMLRNPTDVLQKWSITENKVVLFYKKLFGLTIHLRDNPTLVVQKVKLVENGSANQCWKYENFNFFSISSKLNREITAAFFGNICTYEITKEEISQPGFYSEIKKNGTVEVIYMCHSCSQTLRGTSKLYSLNHHTKFACDIGKIQSESSHSLGNLKCLFGKVDLSLEGVWSTLDYWRTKLKSSFESHRIYAERVRANDEFVRPFLRLVVHRNGDPISEPGVRVCGTNIDEIICQATTKLDLSNAGRKLFQSDGTLIVDESDILRMADGNDDEKVVDAWLSCGESFVEPIGLGEKMTTEKEKRMKINDSRNKICAKSHQKDAKIEYLKERAGLPHRQWKYVTVYYRDISNSKEFYSDSLKKIMNAAQQHFEMAHGTVKLFDRLDNQIFDLGEVNNQEILRISYNDRKMDKKDFDCHVRANWGQANRCNVVDETGLVKGGVI